MFPPPLPVAVIILYTYTCWLFGDQVVMRAIRKVAATQRAVICTIHQPSTYLFEMFDALLLLKKGGQPVFFGALGESSSKLISYLQVRTPAIGSLPSKDRVLSTSCPRA